jgi:hypothetical protein
MGRMIKAAAVAHIWAIFILGGQPYFGRLAAFWAASRILRGQPLSRRPVAFRRPALFR